MSDPSSPSLSTEGIHHLRPTTDANGHGSSDSGGGLIRRSWVAMTDMLTPFSAGALASLPKNLKKSPRYTRADGIPDAEVDDEGNMPAVRDYHAINSLPPQVRIPKKIATPIKVEAKVWFANERSAYLLRTGGELRNGSLTYRIVSSLGCVPQYRCIDWHVGPRSFQRFKGRRRSELRVLLRCRQHRHHSGHPVSRSTPMD